MAPMEDTAFFRWAARYKFTLAMENYVCEDYTTEKLWRPLRLGSVPIVFGAPNVKVSEMTTDYVVCCSVRNVHVLVKTFYRWSHQTGKSDDGRLCQEVANGRFRLYNVNIFGL